MTQPPPHHLLDLLQAQGILRRLWTAWRQQDYQRLPALLHKLLRHPQVEALNVDKTELARSYHTPSFGPLLADLTGKMEGAVRQGHLQHSRDRRRSWTHWKGANLTGTLTPKAWRALKEPPFPTPATLYPCHQPPSNDNAHDTLPDQLRLLANYWAERWQGQVHPQPLQDHLRPSQRQQPPPPPPLEEPNPDVTVSTTHATTAATTATTTLPPHDRPLPPLPPTNRPFLVITGDNLKTVLKTEKDKAAGADGWIASEMKMLPPTELQRLADLYNTVSENGRWPQELRCIMTVFKPKKPQATTPEHLRPLCLLPYLYRLWAKVIWRHLGDDISQQLPPSCKAKKGEDIYRLITDTVVYTELAQSRGESVSGMHSDLTQAYETIPLAMAQRALLQANWHPTLIQLVLNMYSAPRLIIHKGSAQWIYHTHAGIPAGCPLGAVVLQELERPLANALAQQRRLQHRFYMDDTALYSSNKQKEQLTDTLTHAIHAFENWAGNTNIKINATKSSIWATDTKAAKSLSTAHPQYTISQHVRDLGIDLTFSGHYSTTTTTQRVQQAIRVADRVRLLKPPRRTAERMLRAAALSKLWGAAVSGINAGPLKALRAAILRALGTKRGQMRNANAQLCIANTTPNLDPYIYYWAATIINYTKWLRLSQPTSPQLQVLRERGLQESLTNNPKHTWFHRLATIFSNLAWKWDTPTRVTTHDDKHIDLYHIDLHELNHHLREASRTWACQELAHRHDYHGITAFDHKRKVKIDKLIPTDYLGRIYYIRDGGGQSWKQQSHHNDHTPACPLCNHNPCTWEHMLWSCPNTPHRHHIVNNHYRNHTHWNPVFRIRGLPTKDLNMTDHDLRSILIYLAYTHAFWRKSPAQTATTGATAAQTTAAAAAQPAAAAAQPPAAPATHNTYHYQSGSDSDNSDDNDRNQHNRQTAEDLIEENEYGHNPDNHYPQQGAVSLGRF